MTKRKIWVGGLAASVTTVILIAGVVLYIHSIQPTDEQRASDEYAQKIVVQEHHLFDERIDSRLGPKAYAYIGPKRPNPIELISGPGLDLGPPLEWQEPDDLHEPIGHGKVVGLPEGMHCIVTVKRLRGNVDPGDLYDIDARELRKYRTGKLEILEITVPCQSSD